MATLVGPGVQGALEGLFLIAGLFLVTRAWVIVAPIRGRWLGRRVMVAAAPAVLALAVVGRMAVPEGWEVVLESVAFTAFTVSLLLGPVWVLALAVRAIRWMIRRPADRSADRGLLRETVALSICTAAILGLAGLIQWQLHLDELKAERRAHEELGKKLSALEATESRAEEFEGEKQNLEERVTLMRRILPERLDVARFMDRYAGVCQRYGVRLESWSMSKDTSSVVHRAEIHALLDGPPEALDSLGDRTGKLDRLVDWDLLSAEGSFHRVGLTLFAMPARPRTAPRDSCAIAPSQVFLWPLTTRVKAAREERERLCVVLARHEAIRLEVEEYQFLRATLEELVAVVEKALEARPLEDDAPPPSSI